MASMSHPRTRSGSGLWRRTSTVATAVLLLLVGLLAVGEAAPVAAAPEETGPATNLRAQADEGTLLAAEIRRTEYGIPHIKADDWAGLGFGYGYAYAQDNMCLLAEQIVTAGAERSRYFGATDENLRQDLFHQQLIDLRVVEKTLARPPDVPVAGPSQRVRDLVQGEAAGVNLYLSDIGGAAGITDPRCANAPWVRDITEIDLWRTYVDSALRAGRGALASNVVTAQPPGDVAGSSPRAAGDAAPTLEEVAAVDFDEAGSNAYGLGSEATRNGTGMLLGNPHFPWDGGDRFYEMQLTIPGEYNMIGAALSGQPIVEIGHNATMGWSHTVSTARRFTFFGLDLVPGNPTQYIVDGEVRDMTSQVVEVEVDDGTGGTTTVSRTLWSTVYGPIVEVAPLEWTETTAFALKDVNRDAGRTFDGYIEMGQSASVAELDQTLNTWQHLPWINTIAADSTGAAYYADHSVVPNVDQAKLDSCLTPIGQIALVQANVFILDGAREACRWGSDPDARVPGIFGPSNLPRITRSDYVTNSNDSYWLANPEQPLEGYDRIIGVERTARSLRTRLGLRQVQQRLDGSDGLGAPGFTLELLQEVMFSNRVYGAELVRDDLVELCRANPSVTVDGAAVDISEACDVLAAWDTRVDLDSRGAHVFREFARRGGIRFSMPFDVDDPVNTPNTLDTEDPAVLAALARSVRTFRDAGIALDARLGDIQSETRNGEVIPIHGGTGRAGAFNVISAGFDGAEGYDDVTSGASFILAAEFGPNGPTSKAILAYSNSSDPTSPHFADQTRLYSQKQWVDLDYRETDILADPALEITRISQGEVRSPEGRFVEAVYADFLGRAPTDAERTDTAAALVAGTASRGGVASTLARSSEWTSFVVRSLYESTLGRPGEASGVAYWAGTLARGDLSVAQVAARFFSSAEYLDRFAPGELGGWVDDLYQEILHRPSDPAGRAYWVARVAAGGRTPVALAFIQSPESARSRVNNLYRLLLGRPAEPAGLDFWAPRVVAGGDIALAVALAASPEYFGRAQTG